MKPSGKQPKCAKVSALFQQKRCLVMVTFVGLIFMYLLYSYSAGQSSKVKINYGMATGVEDSRSFGVNMTVNDNEKYHLGFNSSTDVLVFIHIQKTGGSTFGRHVARDTVGFPTRCDCVPHRKRCKCNDHSGKYWLFSRDSVGWRCGLHADWTELNDCVPLMLDQIERTERQRRYLYMTVLRDPVQRYLSEWKHVQRGGTWRKARLFCNKRSATLDEIPFCFEGENWANVTLDEFMDCPYNLASNRQTRMLADLSKIGCYNSSAIPDQSRRERLMLDSAIENLRKLAFIGLVERQAETQQLFERTFDVRSTDMLVQLNTTHAEQAVFTESQLERIEQLNKLDIVLYRFAVRLFDARLLSAGISDDLTEQNIEDQKTDLVAMSDHETTDDDYDDVDSDSKVES